MVPLADMVNHALHPNTREADLSERLAAPLWLGRQNHECHNDRTPTPLPAVQNGRLNIVAGRDITKGEVRKLGCKHRPACTS